MGSFFEKVKQDVELVNAYVADPAHIAPSRTDANSNGHFPLNSHGQTGTPRGFNLNSVPHINMGTAGVPNPMQMAAFMAQMNGGGQGVVGGAEDDRHGVGPMRRGPGGNRFNQRMPGPYDRPNKDSRNGGRWNNGVGGRLTPPRGGPGRQPPHRFPDGAAAMGPREAVQGRSLKSYEDLDAAGGSGTGDLDY